MKGLCCYIYIFFRNKCIFDCWGLTFQCLCRLHTKLGLLVLPITLTLITFFTCFPCQTIHSVIMHAWFLRQFFEEKKKRKTRIFGFFTLTLLEILDKTKLCPRKICKQYDNSLEFPYSPFRYHVTNHVFLTCMFFLFYAIMAWRTIKTVVEQERKRMRKID